jgi:putative addiction module component (TIGR02574 family)
MYYLLPMNELLERAKELPVPERVKLVEDIWDSIAEESEAVNLTPAQMSEIERRLEQHRLHPEDAVPWEEVRDRLRNRV